MAKLNRWPAEARTRYKFGGEVILGVIKPVVYEAKLKTRNNIPDLNIFSPRGSWNKAIGKRKISVLGLSTPRQTLR